MWVLVYTGCQWGSFKSGSLLAGWWSITVHQHCPYPRSPSLGPWLLSRSLIGRQHRKTSILCSPTILSSFPSNLKRKIASLSLLCPNILPVSQLLSVLLVLNITHTKNKNSFGGPVVRTLHFHGQGWAQFLGEELAPLSLCGQRKTYEKQMQAFWIPLFLPLLHHFQKLCLYTS